MTLQLLNMCWSKRVRESQKKNNLKTGSICILVEDYYYDKYDK